MRRNGTEFSFARFSSYIIPAAVAGVILVIILFYAFSGSSKPKTADTGSAFITVTPGTGADVSIYMSGNSKKQITAAERLYPTDDHVEVKTGNVTLSIDQDNAKITLDELAEAAYLGKNNNKNAISLLNSYAWVETPAATLDIQLKNFTVTPNAGAIVMVSQNTRASNVYVLQGSAVVLFKGTVASVGVGQELTVITNEVNTLTKIDDQVKPLDDLIRTTPLFIKNNGAAILAAGTGTGATTSSGASGTGTLANSGSTTTDATNGQVITITSPIDESSVKGSTVDIQGNILSNAVTKVTLGDHEALIDPATHTFSYQGYPIAPPTADIIYRADDGSGETLAKGIMTLHVGADRSNRPKPTVTTYPLSSKDFPITRPTDNPYKTSEDVVRIEGTVPADSVDHITINDYRLGSFRSSNTKWHYFANKDTGNLNTGINLYTVKYYDADNKLLHTTLFTIVKDDGQDAPTTDTGSTSSGASGTKQKSSTGSSAPTAG